MRLSSRTGDLRVLLLALTGFLGLASVVRAAPPVPKVDFNREIRPILSKNCFACHGQDEEHRAKGLRFDRRTNALQELKDGTRAIAPGSPDDSELLARITEEDETLRMPPRKSGERLTSRQIDLIRRWIEQGAEYADHWAFVPPRDRPLPDVKARAWPRNGIDSWILERLEREGLHPSSDADRYSLLRRVSLDLRGLPPSPQEIEAFANDHSPDAYERAVDRFLADPAFGERWARPWLDLARYADSAGYGSDPLRTIWRYRDWVIDAFNRNLPYDRFTVEQIAGDLLPNPTVEERVATAFHRNTMTNTEGGTDDEEFRVAAIKDRVDTTLQVWMGLTIGCAKCHSHKFDPFTQEEYYKLYGFFNQSADADRGDESPTLPAPTAEILERNRVIDTRIADLRNTLETGTPELAAAQARWEAELHGSSDWTPLEPSALQSESGASLSVRPDHSIKVEGRAAERDAYTVSASPETKAITAFRLEVLPDSALPHGGSGRAADGNFVLSRFWAETTPRDRPEATPTGRFVRVELPGTSKMLSLAEVQVFSDGRNVAPAGTATQSSVDFDGPPRLAIDGNSDGDYTRAHSTTHTRIESDPWWEVRLAEPRSVERIVVWNRTDGGLGVRLAGYRVSVLDENRKVVWQSDASEAPAPSREHSPTGRRTVSLVRAVADFSQDRFSVEAALAPASAPERGWSVAPRQSEPHAAVFLVREPIETSASSTLVFHLEHRFRDPAYTLGRFRLSVSSDPKALRRAELPEPVLAALDTPAGSRSPKQRELLAAHYRSIAPELRPVRDEIAREEKSRPAVPTVPVMDELPTNRRRETHILTKGNFLTPGAKVEAGLPASLHAMPPGASNDRLGLASWLVDDKNPLTARVAVNRFWSQLFGVGLVETEEDFGTQGDPPSHPELLDWLALEFMRSGWDTKALLREIVTSSTYRQTSRVSPEGLKHDPRNRLLSRGPRFRLEAEMVRDQALALSGLLSRKPGGPSVFPPQPDGLWQAAFNGERTWATSRGEDRYRRGLYTFWRRTVPYPSMATFDAPSREICSVRRVRTNTPLQAFVTLNDPVYVEIAQALGRRIVREGGSSDEDRARFALQLCLGRPAAPRQVESLLGLLRTERERYRKDPKAAEALATDPLGPLPPGMEAADLASWTAVANILLNLDAVLMKG